MKKLTKNLQFISAIFLLASVIGNVPSALAQDLNLTLASTYTYSTGTIANIGGWKSPVDGKEYALVGAHNGLSIVDVSTPTAPVQITLIPGPSSLWREVKMNGNYAYVTTEAGTSGLQIVDLTNLPATNLAVATWTPTILSTQLHTIHALHIDNAKGKVYLYGSNIGNQGAIVADIATNPMAPIYLGYYNNRYIHDGYVRGDTLYACHINNGDLEIVDMRNPAAGVSLADFNTPNNFTHNSWLSTDSKTVYTTDEVPNSFLTSYDISNLNNITELDRIQSSPGTSAWVHNTHIIKVNENDFAVTSWYSDGFTIVDAGRPSNLVQVGNYDTAPTVSGNDENHCWGVYPFLPSGIIVASDMQNGLFVLTPNYVRASYLEGVVMDCNTGHPLFGAKVEILNPPAQNTNSAIDLTDAFGKYGVGVVTPSTYTVTVSKQAYVTQTFTVSVTSGNVTTLNVNLCTQIPTFSFTGNVFNNPTSVGISGAAVHFQDSSIVMDTVTDANGNFTVPNMITGTYEILVGKWGYITKCFSGTNLNSSSPTFSVGLDPGIYDDFSFNFGWTVSGACTNAWERAVPVGTIDAANGNAIANPDKDDQTDCSNQCFITDNGGGVVSDHDVDPPGYTILTSPVFDPSAYSVPAVSYSRWYYDAQLNGNQPNDTMNIYISNGSTTVLLERMIKNTPGNGKWLHKFFKISNFITPTATMQLSMSISDAPPGGTIVEGGFDKFFVYDSANVGVNTISSINENVKVYPNPFSKTTTLEVIGNQSSIIGCEFNMYDVFGREVMSFLINDQKSLINRGDLADGLYLYKISSKGTSVASGKLLIE